MLKYALYILCHGETLQCQPMLMGTLKVGLQEVLLLLLATALLCLFSL
jgi:hypothetical protein